eukprot:UN24129
MFTSSKNMTFCLQTKNSKYVFFCKRGKLKNMNLIFCELIRLSSAVKDYIEIGCKRLKNLNKHEVH